MYKTNHVFSCLLCYLLLSLCIVATASAAEPLNLATVKQQLIRYHDSGAYLKDITAVTENAIDYLRTVLSQQSQKIKDKKPAIVMDIDETVLSNYPSMLAMDFGGTLDSIQDEEDKGLDPTIKPALKLYRFAKAHHVAILFITARYEHERAATELNLKKAGYDSWDALILKPEHSKNQLSSTYKIATRRQFVKQGYHILLNIGDQHSDLVGGYADKTFKLPNPYYLTY